MPLWQQFARLFCVLFLIKPNLFLQWIGDGSVEHTEQEFDAQMTVLGNRVNN